jgi:rhodanese-related sulfurtransferase
MLSLVSASNMLQRVLASAFSSTRSEASSVASRLGNVRQATVAASEPPARPAWHVLLGKACQETGTRSEYAANTLADAGKALRHGNYTRADEFLAIGMDTLAPTRKAATVASAGQSERRSEGSFDAHLLDVRPNADSNAHSARLPSQDWHAVLGVAILGDGTRSKFAANILRDAGTALRNEDMATANDILAKGMKVLFAAVPATGEYSTTSAASETAVEQARKAASAEAATAPEQRKPESTALAAALHAGWEANLGRGVRTLIESFEAQANSDRRDMYREVLDGHPSREKLLDATREDSRLLREDRFACISARHFNKEGRDACALDELRQAPSYERIMKRFEASFGVPEADEAKRALSASSKEFDLFRTLVESDEEIPAGVAGKQVRYARENPSVLHTRQRILSVAEDLFRLHAYDQVSSTLQPPVPPRDA